MQVKYSITELIAQKDSADAQLRAILGRMEEVINEKLFIRYYEKFSQLTQRAEKHRYIIHEVPNCEITSNTVCVYGNGKITRIRIVGNFVHFSKESYQRGEYELIDGCIPLKYLGQDGVQLLDADVRQITADLDQLDAEFATRQKEEQKKRDWAELERLSQKYGFHVPDPT